jgi:TatD DNase family protein
MLIDSHSHIHTKNFDVDREQVVERAKQAGVGILIEVGFNPEGWEKASALAEKYENIYWTAGIHPHEADVATEENLKKMRELKSTPAGKKLVAFGEMGLDYFKNYQPKEIQQKAFRAQLVIAKELDLPVIIHCRDAYSDAFKILEEEGITRAVFHCFAGTLAEAQECFSRGYFVSFTGICTYPKAENIRQIIIAAPVDKIMIETDCPYLAPQSQRGKRNEPAFVAEVFQKVCEIKKISPAELETTLDKYTRLFFSLSDL